MVWVCLDSTRPPVCLPRHIVRVIQADDAKGVLGLVADLCGASAEVTPLRRGPTAVVLTYVAWALWLVSTIAGAIADVRLLGGLQVAGLGASLPHSQRLDASVLALLLLAVCIFALPFAALCTSALARHSYHIGITATLVASSAAGVVHAVMLWIVSRRLSDNAPPYVALVPGGTLVLAAALALLTLVAAMYVAVWSLRDINLLLRSESGYGSALARAKATNRRMTELSLYDALGLGPDVSRFLDKHETPPALVPEPTFELRAHRADVEVARTLAASCSTLGLRQVSARANHCLYLITNLTDLNELKQADVNRNAVLVLAVSTRDLEAEELVRTRQFIDWRRQDIADVARFLTPVRVQDYTHPQAPLLLESGLRPYGVQLMVRGFAAMACAVGMCGSLLSLVGRGPAFTAMTVATVGLMLFGMRLSWTVLRRAISYRGFVLRARLAGLVHVGLAATLTFVGEPTLFRALVMGTLLVCATYWILIPRSEDLDWWLPTYWPPNAVAGVVGTNARFLAELLAFSTLLGLLTFAIRHYT